MWVNYCWPRDIVTCFSKAAGTRRLSSARLLLMRSRRRFSITCIQSKQFQYTTLMLRAEWHVSSTLTSCNPEQWQHQHIRYLVDSCAWEPQVRYDKDTCRLQATPWALEHELQCFPWRPWLRVGSNTCVSLANVQVSHISSSPSPSPLTSDRWSQLQFFSSVHDLVSTYNSQHLKLSTLQRVVCLSLWLSSSAPKYIPRKSGLVCF